MTPSPSPGRPGTRPGDLRRTGQQGYILITTLAAMIVCLVLVTILLSVAFSTSQVEDAGLRDERQVRAAEGALAVAINQLRNNPTLAAQPVPDCSAISPSMTIDGYSVRVGCVADGRDGEPRIPENNNQVALRLVGERYHANGSTDLNGPGYNGLVSSPNMPAWRSNGLWASTLGARYTASELTTNDGGTQGQLVHFGAVPLRVVGALEVKKEVAALRSNAAQTPAVDVYGFASQGGGALWPGSSSRTTQSSPPVDPRCGISEVNDTWNTVAADVASYTDFASSTDAFECGSSRMAGMGEGGTAPPAGDWTNQDVQTRKPTALTAGAGNSANPVANPDCSQWTVTPGSGVIYLEGSFDAEATKILNGTPANPGWFTGGCPERTFLIQGDTWFDVNDPTNPDPRRRNALVFDDRTSNWVFGTPVNWNPSLATPASVPPASNTLFPDRVCANQHNQPNGSPSDTGSSITLSSRTGLIHNTGRVAICGFKAGSADPNTAKLINYHNTALWQRPSTSLGAVLRPRGISGDGDWGSFPGGSKVTNLQTVGNRQGVRSNIPMPDIFDINWTSAGFCWFWESDCNFFSAVWDLIVNNINAIGESLCWIRGDCERQRSFTATGFDVLDSSGAVDTTGADLGPQAITNAWVDIEVDNEYASNPLAYTQFNVSLPAAAGLPARTCSQRYGPNTADRLGDNYELRSYDLMDASKVTPGQNSCASQLADRAQLKDASVTVLFNVNPPAPLTQQLAALCLINIFGWRPFNCTFPSQATVSVDSLALRTEWSPTMGTPTSPAGCYVSPSTGTTAGGTCIAFTNPGNAATKDGNYAVANGNTAKTDYSAYLQYELRDDELRDGFLPVTDLTVNTIMRRNSNLVFTGANPTKVEFILTLPTPGAGGATVECKTTVSGTALETLVGTATPSQPQTIKMIGTGATGNCGTTVKQVGDLVSYTDANGVFRSAKLTVLVYMLANGTNPVSWEVDYVNLTARTGGNYKRPLAPIRVRWNPVLNADNTGFTGDALFTVFGTTSVPQNAVEVEWGSAGRASGYGIFNGANLPIPGGVTVVPECNAPINTISCRPGLIAGAMASWTTETDGRDSGLDPDPWPTGVVPTDRMPDPVATSGGTRPPNRNVRLTACVVDKDKGTPATSDDEIFPRALANVRITDVESNVIRPGAIVTVTRASQILNDAAFLQVGSCSRPADE